MEWREREREKEREGGHCSLATAPIIVAASSRTTKVGRGREGGRSRMRKWLAWLSVGE